MKKRSITRLNFKKRTISKLEKINGGKATNESATICDTVLCMSRGRYCPPPNES